MIIVVVRSGGASRVFFGDVVTEKNFFRDIFWGFGTRIRPLGWGNRGFGRRSLDPPAMKITHTNALAMKDVEGQEPPNNVWRSDEMCSNSHNFLNPRK